MKNPSVLIVHPNNEEQITVLKAFMHALKIKFEIIKKDKYNPEFVTKILERKEEAKKGKITRVKKENLKEFLGLK